ncbi:hypothetical protein F5Y16DRAFT_356734 [Xylariaceae sp. FL0255]|nr:hypothetical protein F5Y16DRAFT_356734 [Xylariaceae sp. FL0255]
MTPCSQTIFFFQRLDIGLVSISEDGVKLPEIYTTRDLTVLANGGSYTPSAVTKINNQDVVDFLNAEAATGNSQDPDARYNTLMAALSAYANSPTDEQAYFGNFVNHGGQWPGDLATLEFENGSTLALHTEATYNTQLPTVSTAKKLWTEACVQDTNATSSNSKAKRGTRTVDSPAKRATSSTAPTFTAGPYGYPTPYVRDAYNQIMGYSLDDDTAVMFIPTFEPASDDPADIDELFADVATKIVNEAIAKGQSKIVIDLSSNGGGDINRGYDLFKLFFPSIQPYLGTRFRRTEVTDLLVQGLRKVTAANGDSNPFAWEAAVNPEQTESYATWQDFVDGGVQMGVNSSSLHANFNFTLFSELDKNTSPIRGYGGVPINKTQPYRAEDIIIITDGICASTCTVFVDL